jgi:hypothetical protein
MSINFQGSKRSEIAELEFELNHNKLERRIEAIKKVSDTCEYFELTNLNR